MRGREKLLANYVLRTIVHIILFFLGSRKVFNSERIPKSGPFIAVTNHLSLADSALLLISAPPMKLRFFAAEKYAKHPIYGPALKWLGAIFIHRGEADRQAISEAFEALKDGQGFGMAPEGTRSHVGAMQRGKDGAVYLALRTGAPIVPIGVVNTDLLFANAKRFKRTRLETHVGEVLTLPDIGRRPRQRELPAYTHYVMVHIAALIPPHYHGYYADSPALAALLRGEDPWPYCLEAEGVLL
jgi:1-acyl-sn-glycerol-3-phosphate acyltransferase